MKQRQRNKNKGNNNNVGGNKNSSKNTPKLERPLYENLSHQAREEMRILIPRLLHVVYEETNAKNEWEQYLKIQEILERIQVLEAPLRRKPTGDKSSRLANIEKFYEWAKENGIQYEGVEIQEFPGYGLGLKATRDIKKDDILFGIPRKLIMSQEHGCSFNPDVFKQSNLKLAFILMVESAKADSMWRPYLDILPDSYNTVLYFKTEEMALLKGSNALTPALKQCCMIARIYAILHHLQTKEDFKNYFSYDLFRWAVSTVMTRENLIPRSKPKAEHETSDTISALIPFWDMANHRDGTITTFFNIATQQVESSAQDDFQKDEQIFIYYGDRSNADFMLHNGFLYADNRKDSVSIRLGLSPSDPLFEKRAKLLELLSIPKNSELKVLRAPEYISADLLGFVRVFNMNEEQLDHWITSERATDLLHIDCALETALESKTWQYLQTRLMLLLRVYPPALEEDEQRLATVKADPLLRDERSTMILEYRVLEKRILAAALDYAKQRTKA